MVYVWEIQKVIDDAIALPSFSAALPPLSEATWRKILVGPSRERYAENDRLEFLGDALMYATLGRQLYAQCPQGTPHLYTVLRAALHSNATFAKLAEKLDVLAVSSVVLNALTAKTFGEGSSACPKERFEVKRTADLFETVIGSYYLECGFERLYDWVQDLYYPLIEAARKHYVTLLSREKLKHAHTVSALQQKLKLSDRRARTIRMLGTKKDHIYSSYRQRAPIPPTFWSDRPQAPPLSTFPHAGYPVAMVPKPVSTAEISPPAIIPANLPPPELLPPMMSSTMPPGLLPPMNTPPTVSSTVPFMPLHDRPFVVPRQPVPASQPVLRESTNAAPRNLVSSAQLPQKSRLLPAIGKAQTPLRLPTPRKRITPIRPKAPPIVIDLTLDDDTPPSSRESSPIEKPGSPPPSDPSDTSEDADMDETEDMLLEGQPGRSPLSDDELEDMLISDGDYGQESKDEDDEDDVPVLTVFS